MSSNTVIALFFMYVSTFHQRLQLQKKTLSTSLPPCQPGVSSPGVSFKWCILCMYVIASTYSQRLYV